MKNRDFVIVANGESPNPEIVKQIMLSDHRVVAADGGIVNCDILGLKPDIIIGDLDSINGDLLLAYRSSEIINDPDQESTDLEKALNYITKYDPKTVKVLGCSGLRTDHFLGNILILHNHSLSSKIEYYDRFGRIRILDEGITRFRLPMGTVVSIFALLPVTELNLQGFLYPLSNRDISLLFYGISNVTNSETCVVSFQGGKLIVYNKMF